MLEKELTKSGEMYSTTLTFPRAARRETTMNINKIVRMVKKGVEGLADNGNYLTDVVAFYRSVQRTEGSTRGMPWKCS